MTAEKTKDFYLPLDDDSFWVDNDVNFTRVNSFIRGNNHEEEEQDRCNYSRK